MPKFPEPPPAVELARVGPEATTLSAGTVLWRIYFRGGPHPTLWNTFRSFGPVNSRFDHHLPRPRLQERKILYAAIEGPTSVAEVFQETRVIDRAGRDPWLVGFRLRQPLALLDLTGVWPTRAGASMVISSGPRPRAQRWSRAIYGAFPDLAGLRYPSSMYGGRPAVALYERAEGAIDTHPTFHRSLADPALLRMLNRLAADLGYGLA